LIGTVISKGDRCCIVLVKMENGNSNLADLDTSPVAIGTFAIFSNKETYSTLLYFQNVVATCH